MTDKRQNNHKNQTAMSFGVYQEKLIFWKYFLLYKKHLVLSWHQNPKCYNMSDKNEKNIEQIYIWKPKTTRLSHSQHQYGSYETKTQITPP